MELPLFLDVEKDVTYDEKYSSLFLASKEATAAPETYAEPIPPIAQDPEPVSPTFGVPSPTRVLNTFTLSGKPFYETLTPQL